MSKFKIAITGSKYSNEITETEYAQALKILTESKGCVTLYVTANLPVGEYHYVTYSYTQILFLKKYI